MTQGIGEESAQPRYVGTREAGSGFGSEEAVYRLRGQPVGAHPPERRDDVDPHRLGITGARIVGVDPAIDDGLEPVVQPGGKGHCHLASRSAAKGTVVGRRSLG
jgi:hypothetical protein